MVLDGRGGEAIDYVTIEVRTNRSPTINSLIADADWTLPSGSLNVTCDASDPDGDELGYEWTATGGNITGTGPEVIWTAPQQVGVYNVTVVVSDGHGRTDTRAVPLSVVLGTPPTVEDLTITAKEPKYLKKTSAGYTVGRTKEYDIECIVSDTSGEVSYEWSCEDGEISGEGSIITWTAPDESLSSTTVTVIVSDVADNSVAKSIVFQVASCNACTFG
jgi:RecJ-like exonuclease